MENGLHVKIEGAVATVTLTRPRVHNALDEAQVINLTQAFQKLGVAEAVRVIVLEAEGKSFCAGLDVGWVRQSAGSSKEDNQRDAMMLAVLMDAIDRCPKPVIAVVNGAALGGGVGLVAAADVALASEEASFALTEVRLGLEPTIIGPQVVAAMGARACRRYWLTAERFDAREAFRLGLVHAVLAADNLAEARDRMVEACLKGAPGAQAGSKEAIRVIDAAEHGPDLMRLIAHRFAEQRAGDEGREGLAAFTEKRKPTWST
ncbi:enoyl-CoA hydratase-related protein [Magnetospirillum sulfuroxidans]|uniref:Enoyl-CoA hydratase/isomerase family protein n=1 Tax=Magnetospirillum sulfuroxidans TaxID=611300 RepID=A0ABS5IEP1_9PROT|nr:enoyl-CoA hydratase-related protein [Magnetospirillum sulfuroxidans]MBR9972881.1 enoyl-CoA hydratase/isomerase family protein [Magnetospirillum sulfuroxidans]